MSASTKIKKASNRTNGKIRQLIVKHQNCQKLHKFKSNNNLNFTTRILKPFALNLKPIDGFEICKRLDISAFENVNDMAELQLMIDLYPKIPEDFKQNEALVNLNDYTEMFTYFIKVYDALFPDGYSREEYFQYSLDPVILTLEASKAFNITNFDCSIIENLKSKKVKKVFKAVIDLLYCDLHFHAHTDLYQCENLISDEEYLKEKINDEYGIGETGQDLENSVLLSIYDNILSQKDDCENYFENVKSKVNIEKSKKIINNYLKELKGQSDVNLELGVVENWLNSLLILSDSKFDNHYDSIDQETDFKFSNCFTLVYDENLAFSKFMEHSSEESHYGYSDTAMYYYSYLSEEDGFRVVSTQNTVIETAVEYLIDNCTKVMLTIKNLY